MTERRQRPRRGAAPLAASDSHGRARETLAREVGYVRKPHGGRLRVALAFPNTYFVGMSNLGPADRLSVVQCRRARGLRARVPARQAGACEVRPRGASRSSPSNRRHRSRDFDVFAFSVSFEWDYTNVVTMLRLAGLEPRADRRHARDPLVVIGGAVTFVNPEPLAPFADVIAAGEAELLVPALDRCLRGGGERAIVRALLSRLSQARGFYIPSLYDVTYDGPGRVAAITPKPGSGAPAVVTKAAVKAADRLDPPSTSIFTPDTEFGSRLLIEVVRGCANLCRFCWAGYNYLPVRPFSTERILEIARGGPAALQPRRPRVDCSVRPPRHRAHPERARGHGLQHLARVAQA